MRRRRVSGAKRARGRATAAAAALAAVIVLAVSLAASRAAAPAILLVLGDSLVAGYGLAAADAFPQRLEAALAAHGYSVRVVNGGVSGDTSADGRARLEWALADRPQFAIVELGANDALRGLDPALTYANLDAILDTLGKRGVRVLLAGMKAPRNLGGEYARAFDSVYPRLSEKYKVALYPFFLDGVALHPDLLQQDGLHPNPKGVAVIVRHILPAVETLLGPAGREATK